MEPRPIVFKEWRDTRTFSNLKSTHYWGEMPMEGRLSSTNSTIA
jgi:hypothetical protein